MDRDGGTDSGGDACGDRRSDPGGSAAGGASGTGRTAVPAGNLRHHVRFGGPAWTATDLLFVAALLASGWWIYLRDLGSYGLQTWDEGNYGNVARFVLEGYVVVPRYYSFLGPASVEPYLEKPPLGFWFEALSLLLAGDSAFGARLPSATFAVLTGLVVYSFGRAWATRRTGLVAGIAFLTTPLLYAGNNGGRAGGVDVPMLFFGACFLFFAWLAAIEDRRWTVPMWFAGVAAALVKGLGAAIFVLALAPLAATVPRPFRSRRSLAAMAAAAGLGALWPLAAVAIHGRRVADQLIVEQVLGRVTGETGTTYDGVTFEFMRYPYFAHLPSFHDPWLFLLLPGTLALAALATGRRDRRTVAWLAWWTALVPLFFAATGGNHPWYLFPMFVPASLLVGRTIDAAARGRSTARLAVLAGIAGTVAFSFRLPVGSPLAIERAGALQGDVASGLPVLAAIGGGGLVVLLAPRLAAVGRASVDSELGARVRDRAASRSAVGAVRRSLAGVPLGAVVAAALAVLFVVGAAAAPALTGTTWDQRQQALGVTADDAMPPDEPLAVEPAATDDAAFHAFAFAANRPLRAASTETIDGDRGVRFALVTAGTADGLDRPHERLESVETPGGTVVVLVAFVDDPPPDRRLSSR